jgi:hypothetical protein
MAKDLVMFNQDLFSQLMLKEKLMKNFWQLSRKNGAETLKRPKKVK